MRQASILGWLAEEEEPREVPKHVYLFLADIPEIMLPDLRTAGPFARGDMLTENMLPDEVWRVLLRRGVVVRFNLYPNWPGGGRE